MNIKDIIEEIALSRKDLLEPISRNFPSDPLVEVVEVEEQSVTLVDRDEVLLVYPGLMTGTWFRVITPNSKYLISKDEYKRAIKYIKGTNRVLYYTVGKPKRRLPEVPPL